MINLVGSIGGAAEFAEPGEVLRALVDAHEELTQERLAERIGVSRLSINQLINGHRTVTAEMALRLAKAFSTTPEFWLKLQMEKDLAEAKAHIGTELAQINVVRRPVAEASLFFDK